MNAGDRLDTLAGMWAVNPPTAFAFDFETSSVNPYAAHIVGISIAFMWGDDLVSEYFPIAHEQPLNTILGWHSGPGEWEPHPENIEWSVVVAALGPYFANPAILKIAHNAKYDLTVGRRNGLEVVSVYDTLLSAWCLGSWSRYGLKYLVQAIFQHQMVEFTDLTTYKVGRKQMSRPFAQVEFVRAMMYGMEDAYWTLRLYEYLESEYEKRPNVRPLFEMENRLMGIVADMEANGILVDLAYLREFKQALDDRISQLEAQLSVFGVSAYSPQSVAGWYVAKGCKLEHYGSSKGKNGHYSVASEVLERIARDLKCRPEFRTVALAVNECRTLSKLRSTYVDSWMGAIGADGRIHATFDQRGAGTGRFSSSSPNLQNVPAFPVLGKHMRKAVIAPPGFKLVSIDYSQIELRTLAHICGDDNLCDAFWHDRDVHTATAAAVYGIAPEQVSKAQRQNGKAQPLDALICTPSGWVCMGDLQVGDAIIDPATGSATKVSAIYPQGIRDVYRVSFSDGTFADCDLDHLWTVARKNKGTGLMTAPLREIIADGYSFKRSNGRNEWKYHIPLTRPVCFSPKAKLPFDPYVLGVLLGDGGISSPGVYFASEDDHIIRSVSERVSKYGWSVRHSGRCSYRITQGGHSGVRGKQVNGPQAMLRSLGVMGKGSYDKFIPEQYLTASVEDRLELLRGLMDTDGYVSRKGHISFSSMSEKLAFGVADLVRSLGGFAKVACSKTVRVAGSVRLVYEVNLRVNFDPFSLARKRERVSVRRQTNWKAIVGVEVLNRSPMQCISVESPTQLYLTNGFTVTHNTLNFAIAYGGGPGVIQVRTGMSRSEAQELYDTFKRTYPGITRYMNEMVDFATATGYIETYLGRRVYVGKGDDGRAYSTVAVNSPIQGSAADIIKLAMVRIQPLLEQYGADLQLVMQVHDELVFYIHESVLAEVVPQLVDAMETVVELSVPLRVDAEAGDNWYDVVAMDGIEHAPFDVGAAQVRMLI